MFALIIYGSASLNAMILRWALQGYHDPLVICCDLCYMLYFCVICVAWQTYKDHVVRPRRRRWLRCRGHTFRLRSVTFEGMHWCHSNFAELYITVQYRSSSILVIIRQILAELWPFFDLSFCSGLLVCPGILLRLAVLWIWGLPLHLSRRANLL